MKNVLSYQPGSIFTGKELNDVFSHAIENKTSKAKIAKKYVEHFRFKDNRPECAMFIRVQ